MKPVDHGGSFNVHYRWCVSGCDEAQSIAKAGPLRGPQLMLRIFLFFYLFIYCEGARVGEFHLRSADPSP